MKAFEFQPQFNKTILSQGVRVLSEHHPYSRATVASVYVDLGSRDEPSSLMGAAHFIEHLVFKGTQRRSSLDIARALEAVGGELNAFTGREATCFHGATLKEHLKLNLDVLLDLVSQARFDREDFERERQVILQEIDMSVDQLEEYILDLYFEQAYPGEPLGQSILGTKESLLAIDREALRSYYQEFYRGPHLVVSVAGDVDHGQLVDWVEEELANWQALPSPPAQHQAQVQSLTPRVRPPAKGPKAFRHLMQRPSEQVHIMMGYPSSAFVHPLRFESYLVNALLGGGMTSRLYQIIREEKALAYSVYSMLHSFTDSGLLCFYAGTQLESVPEVMKVIRQEVARLKREGMKQEDLDFFKTQVKGQILLAADDIENRMNSLAVNEMVFSEYRPVESVIAEIERVNRDSVQEYLESFLKDEDLGVLLLGDVPDNEAEKYL